MEEVTIEGSVSSVIFNNNDTGYTIFSVEYKDKEIVCTGYIAELAIGENVKLVGQYNIHPVYGKQLNVKLYEKTIPTSTDGIEKYLSSGVVKGIGNKIAKKIIKQFGDQTLDIIENEPEKLACIKGISLDKARTISSVFNEQAQLRKIMMFLQSFDITSGLSLKIYTKYKANSIEIVKTNPYKIADEITGAAFKTADKIANKVGISLDSPYRIKAGIKYCLKEAAENGNVYLPKNILKDRVSKLLQLNTDLIENFFVELHIDKTIWVQKKIDQEFVYLNYFYYAESYVAKKILELSNNFVERSDKYIQKIKDLEKQNNIELDDIQMKAVLEALCNGVLIITGGPGTGKTTTINIIISMLSNEGYTIELAAPTGRAAKRMTEATKLEAKTIHRLLGISFLISNNKSQIFEKNEDNPIDADVIIIDESSMMDILLMNSLLKAIEIGTRLILVGDVDQLPSVGPGSVLKDIINSNCLKVVRLDKVFRQAQKSAIVMNAHRINHGKYPILNEKDKDFFFIKKESVADLIEELLNLVTDRIPKFLKCDKFKDIQILTPMKKTPLGIINLNTKLQERLNPRSISKKEKEFRDIVFREGDKVMQLKNNYNITYKIVDDQGFTVETGLGVFNGDEGFILKIDEYAKTVTICFDEFKHVDYNFEQLDEIDLAYAITIHKSQGSEYKVVVMPIHGGPPMLLNRNLLYTAVTRAKNMAIIIGRKNILYSMVDNKKEIDRFTSLEDKIIEMHKYIVGEHND